MANSVSEDITRIWKTRPEQVISDQTVSALTDALADSTAALTASVVVGGAEPTGLGIRLTYDSIEDCGNDLRHLLDLIGQHIPPPPPPPGDPWPIIRVVREIDDRLSILLALGVLPPEADDAIHNGLQVAGLR